MLEADAVEDVAEQLTVFRCVDHRRRCANDVDAVCFEFGCEVQWSLTAELDDHTVAARLSVNFENVLECEWFEEELVGCIVVSRNGFRIRVDHNGFETCVAKREGGVHAAVVKFDALADTIRTTAENHDLLLVALYNFVFRTVRGIVIRCERFELSRASINQAEVGQHAELFAAFAHGCTVGVNQVCNQCIAEAGFLRSLHQFSIELSETALTQVAFDLNEFTELGDEPRVECAGVEDFFIGHAVEECMAEPEHAFARWDRDALADSLHVGDLFLEFSWANKAFGADFE